MRTRRSPRNQERLWKELGGTTANPASYQGPGKTVMIDNLPYPIVEQLGFQGGYKAIAVRTSTGAERIAVWRGNNWRWWSTYDRLGQG